ncbi:MAG: hypothetical protein U0169_24315 [Polyangiaceae bacterium]
MRALPFARFAPVALASLGLALGACSSPTGDEEVVDGSEEAAVERNQLKSCNDVVPQADETVTDARARCLTGMASEFLAKHDKAATDAGLAKLSATYKIRVDGGSCFKEEKSGWTQNYDLKGSNDVERLRLQMKYAAEFLMRFHEDAAGYPNRYFENVALCPRDSIDADMLLQGKTLYVGMTMGWWNLSSIQVRDAFELRRFWSAGDHLKQEFPQVIPYWRLLDPIGAPRRALRKLIGEGARVVKERLGAAKAKSELEVRADVKEMVSTVVSPSLKANDGSGSLLQNLAMKKIDALTKDQLVDLAERWSSFVEDRENLEGMTEAVLATHEATATKSYKVDIEQRGLVAVGNFHDIDVKVSALLPRGKQFSRYVTIERVENEIKVRQYALVAVYTIDNVSVNLAIGADRGLETAGFEHALARVAP